MNKTGKIISLAISIIIFLLGVGYLTTRKDTAQFEQFQGRERKSLTIGDHVFDVVISRTQAELTQGLSGTHLIEEHEGMLFVFPTPGAYNFWMKDMNYPIDILWVNKDNKIIFIQKNATPESYPDSFGPTDVQALMVLEIRAGLSDKFGITTNDSIVIK